ncbi:hypothetical protein ISN75_06800 [Dyella marensis]|uniref:hypothetical protein n=1 Tax=Dyella marensis TaxID=500610 RepID=UPI0031E17476
MSAPKMAGWLDKVANGDEKLGVKADPGKAVDLILKAAEYHIPKLARTEHSGEVTQNHTGEVGIRPQLTREEWLALHSGEK